MPEPSQSPDEYPLSPEEPPPEIEHRMSAPVIEPAEPPVNREKDQFTLNELLRLVTAMAVLMSLIASLGHWRFLENSPAQLAAAYATFFGFGAMVGMIALAWIPNPRRILVVGWWVLLGLYIVTAAVAVLVSK